MGQDFRLSDLHGARIHSVPIGDGTKGFTFVSGKGVQHIFLEEGLSPECKIETLMHETYHLKHDKISYGIGLDVQDEESEKMADRFAKQNARRCLKLISQSKAI